MKDDFKDEKWLDQQAARLLKKYSKDKEERIETEMYMRHLLPPESMFSTYKRKVEYPTINYVLFNDPATIVFWNDGTKTVVKCDKNEEYDPEKGMAMAVAKKFLGTSKNKGNYYNVFSKWLTKEAEDSFNKLVDDFGGMNKFVEWTHEIAKIFKGD